MKEKIIFEHGGKGKNNHRYSHGHCIDGYSKTYMVWASMLQRVTNPKNRDYKNYGGRGITVSDEWLIYDNFLADMGEKPHVNLTLERTDNGLGYCKENCVWATRTAQAKNKRPLKLSQADVLEIRQRLKDGERGVDIAYLFSVSKTTISEIKSGRTHANK